MAFGLGRCDMRKSVRRGRAALAVALIGATLLLGACGGDEEEAAVAQNPPAPPAPPPPSPSNQAPTISGSPAPQVMQGTQYSFTPTANDPNGDTLTFSIVNGPSWATFTPTNGRLTGTPGAADVRTYSNIQISVSDGTNTVNLPAFSIAVVATATGSATLSWLPPTTNTDGSPLTTLAGYRVHWGTTQGNLTNSVLINNPGLASYFVDQLTPGTWYFAVTAVSASGESAYSNVAQKTI